MLLRSNALGSEKRENVVAVRTVDGLTGYGRRVVLTSGASVVVTMGSVASVVVVVVDVVVVVVVVVEGAPPPAATSLRSGSLPWEKDWSRRLLPILLCCLRRCCCVGEFIQNSRESRWDDKADVIEIQ